MNEAILLAVALYLHDSMESVRAACEGADACARVNGHACEVHLMRSFIGDRIAQQQLGHEFLHCAQGAYH